MFLSQFYLRKIHIVCMCACMVSVSSCAKKPVINNNLSGPWLINILNNDVGKMQAVMSFDMDEQSTPNNFLFHAYTEKEQDAKLLGFWKAHAGRVMGSNFENGSLIRIVKGKYSADSLSGVLVSPFGNYYVNASVKGNKIDGRLSNGRHSIVGYFSGSKGLPALPLHNYPAIVDSAIALTKSKLYDPAILQSDNWKEFTIEMRRIAATNKDDAGLIMSFFYYSHKLLPFTHYALYHPLNLSDNHNLNKENLVSLEEKSARTIVMNIASFSGSAEEMDTAFEQVTAKGYDTLIVDLRNNPGGTVEAGIGFLRHLIQDTLYGGIFLTQKYFINHTTPPAFNEYKAFPHFSKANFNLIIKGISEYPAMCLVAYPQAPVYKGKIYILTNSNTASTCEPIVYGFKQHHIATIVGERTAGAMLNGEQYEINDGFSLTVPTATYYTSDGIKIDKKGVDPDIKVMADDALNAILQKTLP